MNEANVKMPEVLQRYYDAKNRHDIDAMADCFAPDALVHDEGENIRGKGAIKAWIIRTTEMYRVQVEVKDAKEEDEKVVVTALVSGSFDGSPLEMTYAFTLKDNLIADLGID